MVNLQHSDFQIYLTSGITSIMQGKLWDALKGAKSQVTSKTFKGIVLQCPFCLRDIYEVSLNSPE